MVDLHMHIHASDGTDSTEKLLKKLRSAGIKTFSVTDHDTRKADWARKKSPSRCEQWNLFYLWCMGDEMAKAGIVKLNNKMG